MLILFSYAIYLLLGVVNKTFVKRESRKMENGRTENGEQEMLLRNASRNPSENALGNASMNALGNGSRNADKVLKQFLLL